MFFISREILKVSRMGFLGFFRFCGVFCGLLSLKILKQTFHTVFETELDQVPEGGYVMMVACATVTRQQ